MKHLFTFILSVSLLLSLVAPQKVAACDRSQLTFDSLVASGPNYLLYVTLCIGTGRNGIIQGGDQNTGRFSFGFFDSAAGFSISAVAPTTVTPALFPSTASYSTTAAGGGIFCPPAPNPFNTSCMVNYGPTTAGRFFGCITNTLNCGDTATQCFQFTFTFNQIPDSMRVYGVEGGNIATNGCFPNADMALDFGGLPVVWGSFLGSATEAGVSLNWVAFNEDPQGSYRITRSSDGTRFDQIGSVSSHPMEENKYGSYQFFDPNPNLGINYYRLVQVNASGQQTSSEVVQVMFNAPTSTQWNFVSPVPSQGNVTLSFTSPSNQNFSLSVFDTKGALVHSHQISALLGTTEQVLDMSTWHSGCYFVRLQGADGSMLEKKIVKF
jgi:hypothetical protein